jgi:NTE family protein
MARTPARLAKTHREEKRPPFDQIALLLQGGGALGAYQAGVFEALAESGLEPDWIAGISIGAINSAIIAGNPPEHRVERLRAFWEEITTDLQGAEMGPLLPEAMLGDAYRGMLSRLGSTLSLVQGQRGFFAPRPMPPFLAMPGSPAATSFYDTAALESTLTRLVDFDRINSSPMRFSVGAVNVRTGNFVYFDNRTHRIGPRHVMASGSLPPGFPAVEIEGEHYWDGGLVSNTPLQYVLDTLPRRDTLAFQVDLWNARGELPRDIAEVMSREKEIRFSSRTRLNTDYMTRMQRLRRAADELLRKLPPELAQCVEAEILRPFACERVYNVVHLIYRSKGFEDQAKDYEFSKIGMREHWTAGYHDAVHTLRHKDIFQRPAQGDPVRVFDFTNER